MFKELSEPRPVGSGIDFLGYVVRRTYRLPRRRVLRQAQARLAGFAAELVHPLAAVADDIAGKPAPAIPVSHLPRIVAALRRAGRAYVIVREEGYLKRGLKRRVLSEIGGTASWASLAAGPTI
jgi:hypothetical protein